MALSDLVDLETLVKVKKASPVVTVIPFDLAVWVLRAMMAFGTTNQPSIDQSHVLYWQATVKGLTTLIVPSDQVTFNQVGRALKAMGLETWRKADGFHVAWSAAQLDILRTYFKA